MQLSERKDGFILVPAFISVCSGLYCLDMGFSSHGQKLCRLRHFRTLLKYEEMVKRCLPACLPSLHHACLARAPAKSLVLLGYPVPCLSS